MEHYLDILLAGGLKRQPVISAVDKQPKKREKVNRKEKVSVLKPKGRNFKSKKR